MVKKLLTFIMLIFIIIGFCMGIYFAFFSIEKEKKQKNGIDNVFEKIQSKQVEVTEFFTYGNHFNFSGILKNISKDNFESVKLYITDGNEYEQIFKLDGKFEEGNLIISSNAELNSGLSLDELSIGEYCILVRLKLNNSINPKYYSLDNKSEYKDIEYYTITKNDSNNKIDIKFKTKEYNDQIIQYLSFNVSYVEQMENNIYDIVIDAGHGGKDKGEKLGADTEADITLQYAKLLKEKLETQGLKVKLTRDDLNTSSYTSTNMYDSDGRISLACESKAKLMISLHINNGNSGLRGLEVYSPSKSNLEFAQNLANKIVTYTGLQFSNNNSFKKAEGVYVRNFTQSVINEYTNTANKKGYEPYNIDFETPYLYTIREVGGIATNAYVDGRNISYSANKYYKSNQGIECYQIEMGYIKNDLDIIKNQMNEYVIAISEAILEKI